MRGFQGVASDANGKTPQMQEPSFSTGYENLTLSDRLLRVFRAPQSSYEAVRDEPTATDWMLPVALMCVVWMASNYLTLPVTGDPGLPAMQEQLRGMSDEERDMALKNLEAWREQRWITDPLIGAFSSAVIVGVLLLGVGHWVLRVDVTLRQMLVVKGYAAVIGALEFVVRTPLMLFYQQPMLHLGPGAFLSKEQASTFFGRLLIGANLFDIWQVWVIGIGLAVMARAPLHKGIATVFVMWGLWIAMGAAAGGVTQPPPTAQ